MTLTLSPCDRETEAWYATGTSLDDFSGAGDAEEEEEESLLPLLADEDDDGAAAADDERTRMPRKATPSSRPFLQKDTVWASRSIPQVMTSPALQCSP